MDEKKFTTKQFVEMALLTAVIVLMAFTPIGYIKTFGGSGSRSGVWDYQFSSVFWDECIWNDAAWHSAGVYIFCLCGVQGIDGMADRADLPGAEKSKAAA